MVGDLPPGAVFAGYRIEGVVGRGGMGVIYRAIQVGLDRTVAIKVIAPEMADDPSFRARFKRESQIAARIEHPNVIPIYEAGEVEDGTLFISMRFVEGTDLRAAIKEEGMLDPERAAGLVAQVGEALDAAHAHGLVHRDIKPANVLISGRGRKEHAYLTDFGLVKTEQAAQTLTRAGQWVGTLSFAAPEQVRGEKVTARTDVYSLGCVLYAAVTGEVPFPRDTDAARLFAHLHDPPPKPSNKREGIAAALDDVIARAMAKDPAQRWATAGELGRAAVEALEAPTSAARPTQARIDSTTRAMERPSGPRFEKDRPAQGGAQSGQRAAGAGAGSDAGTHRLPIPPREPAPASRAILPPTEVAPPSQVQLPPTEMAPPSQVPLPPTELAQPSLYPLPPTRESPPVPPSHGGAGGAAGAAGWGSQPSFEPSTQAMPAGEAGYAGTGTSEQPMRAVTTPKRRLWPLIVFGVLAAAGLLAAGLVLSGVLGGSDKGGGGSGGGQSFSDVKPRVPTKPIKTGGKPDGMAVGFGSVWVALGTGAGGDRVARIDPKKGRVIDKINTGPDVDSVAVGEGAVWVTNSGGNGSVSRIDAETNRATTAAGDVGGPLEGIAAGKGAIWVCQPNPNGNGQLIKLDRSGEVVDSIDLGFESRPTSVAAGPEGVWVNLAGQGKIVQIDPATDEVVAEVEVGGNNRAVALGNGFVWVTSAELNQVMRIDPKHPDAEPLVDNTGIKPIGVAVDKGHVVVVNTARRGQGSLAILDGKLKRLKDNIAVAGMPIFVAISNGIAFVGQLEAGTVTPVKLP